MSYGTKKVDICLECLFFVNIGICLKHMSIVSSSSNHPRVIKSTFT